MDNPVRLWIWFKGGGAMSTPMSLDQATFQMEGFLGRWEKEKQDLPELQRNMRVTFCTGEPLYPARTFLVSEVIAMAIDPIENNDLQRRSIEVQEKMADLAEKQLRQGEEWRGDTE